MTIKIEKNQIDELINTYLEANNMRLVDVDEPTHELCEYFALYNTPVMVFEGGNQKLMVYTHHVEVAECHLNVYDIDVYIRK